jgi:hypothetical protein
LEGARYEGLRTGKKLQVISWIVEGEFFSEKGGTIQILKWEVGTGQRSGVGDSEFVYVLVYTLTNIIDDNNKNSVCSKIGRKMKDGNK